MSTAGSVNEQQRPRGERRILCGRAPRAVIVCPPRSSVSTPAVVPTAAAQTASLPIRHHTRPTGRKNPPVAPTCGAVEASGFMVHGSGMQTEQRARVHGGQYIPTLRQNVVSKSSWNNGGDLSPRHSQVVPASSRGGTEAYTNYQSFTPRNLSTPRSSPRSDVSGENFRYTSRYRRADAKTSGMAPQANNFNVINNYPTGVDIPLSFKPRKHNLENHPHLRVLSRASSKCSSLQSEGPIVSPRDQRWKDAGHYRFCPNRFQDVSKNIANPPVRVPALPDPKVQLTLANMQAEMNQNPERHQIFQGEFGEAVSMTRGQLGSNIGVLKDCQKNWRQNYMRPLKGANFK